MPKQVSIPGVGLVDFPDEMSDNDISDASAKIYAQAHQPKVEPHAQAKINERSPEAETPEAPVAPEGLPLGINAQPQMNPQTPSPSEAGPASAKILGGVTDFLSSAPLLKAAQGVKNPYLGGAAETGAEMATPMNALLIPAIAAAPEVVAPAIGAYFGSQMLLNAYHNARQAYEAYKSGNTDLAKRLLTKAGLSGAMSAGAVAGATRSGGPEVVQTEEGPILKNEPASEPATAKLNEAVAESGKPAPEAIAEAKGIETPRVEQATEPISSSVSAPSPDPYAHWTVTDSTGYARAAYNEAKARELFLRDPGSKVIDSNGNTPEWAGGEGTSNLSPEEQAFLDRYEGMEYEDIERGNGPNQTPLIWDKLQDLKRRNGESVIKTEAPPASPEAVPQIAHEAEHIAADEGEGPPPPEGPGANDEIAERTAAQIDAQNGNETTQVGNEKNAALAGESLNSAQETDYSGPQRKAARDFFRAKFRNFVTAFDPSTTLFASDLDKLYQPVSTRIVRDMVGNQLGVEDQGRAWVENNPTINDAEAFLDKLPVDEQMKVWSAIRGFRPLEYPELTDFVRLVRAVENQKFKQKSLLWPNLNFLENHALVSWKAGPDGIEFGRPLPNGSFVGRRPPQGLMESFKPNSRIDPYQLYQDGYVPRYSNPATGWKYSIAQDNAFINTTKALIEGKDQGVVGQFGKDERPPEGWQPLNSHLSAVSDESGKWFAEPNFARMFNNFTSQNLFAMKGSLTAGLLASKYAATGVELMLPVPHVFNLGMVKMSAKIANRASSAINRIGADVPIEDILQDAHVSQAEAKNAFLSSALCKAMGDENANPMVRGALQDLTRSGLTMNWDRNQISKSLKAMKESWDNSEYGSLIKNTLNLPHSAIAGPIFKVLQMGKLSHAFQTYGQLLADNASDLATGKVDRLDLARKAVVEADDVFGMVNYQHGWFWDQTLKGAMQLAFRAPAWMIGTLRVGGRGVAEAGQFFRDLMQKAADPAETNPKLGHSAALVASMFLTTAALNVALQYGRTGKTPGDTGDLDDFIWPRDGGVDENGKPTRTSTFGYVNEWVNWLRDPWRTLMGKRQTMISRTAEAFEGKDFYGRQLYAPEDPLALKVAKGAAHLLPVPIAVSATREQQLRQRPLSEQVEAATGIFRPAPRDVNQTEAEKLMQKFAHANSSVGGSTEEQWADRQQYKAWVDRLRTGDNTVTQEMADKGVSHTLIRKAQKQASMPGDAWQFEKLPIDQAQKVYRVATPDEKQLFQPLLIQKLRDAQNAAGRAAYPEQRMKQIEEIRGSLESP